MPDFTDGLQIVDAAAKHIEDVVRDEHTPPLMKRSQRQLDVLSRCLAMAMMCWHGNLKLAKKLQVQVHVLTFTTKVTTDVSLALITHTPSFRSCRTYSLVWERSHCRRIFW